MKPDMSSNLKESKLNNFLLAAGTLLTREIVRFLRQRNRIIGALATPLIFWVLIGSGLGASFQLPGQLATAGSKINSLQYFFPGTIVMIILFTAIFSTISIIEDRREGFLQGVLVAPVHRGAIMLGKMMGGTVLAVGQAGLFLILSPLLGIRFSVPDLMYVAMVMVLVALALTGLGCVIAWKMDSTQGFHAIMNLFLMPMWFLSGSLFPLDGAPMWLKSVMLLNPLSYGVASLQQTMFGRIFSASNPLSSRGFCLGVTALFALVMFAAATAIASKKD